MSENATELEETAVLLKLDSLPLLWASIRYQKKQPERDQTKIAKCEKILEKSLKFEPPPFCLGLLGVHWPHHKRHFDAS